MGVGGGVGFWWENVWKNEIVREKEHHKWKFPTSKPIDLGDGKKHPKPNTIW